MQADERQCRKHHHDALREIEHARGFEDQDEAERDQRVEHTADETFPQRLHEQIGRADHLHEGIDEDRVQEAQCTTPKYASITFWSLRTSSGLPSAILLP